MHRATILLTSGLILVSAGVSRANPPVAAYIFPAGGQRGQTVNVRVGGLFLHDHCSFEMLGPGVVASRVLRRTPTIWFEGPLLPLPESQQAEDYPQDYAGQIRITPDSPLGLRPWCLWTSQGAAAGPVHFMVGDLPEIVEQEIAGDPVPVAVRLPVTINGRIFPRENVDIWSFSAKKGQSIAAEVFAARLGSPLDSYLEVIDPQGRRIAENDDTFGADSLARFTAALDGQYQVRIRDVNFRGGPAYVYRLTLTAGPYVERAYPLGARRGSTAAFELTGQGLPKGTVHIAVPADAPPEYAHRLTVAGQQSNPFFLDVDELPEYRETEPNDQPAQAQRVVLPAVLNGRIDKAGDVDFWAFQARKGTAYQFAVRALALGSPLHAVLAVTDASGKELARADAPAPGKLDPVLRFTAPADGLYCLRVANLFPSRGGPAYTYRLHAQLEANPDFRLRLAENVLTLNRGGQAKLKVLADRTAAPGPMQLAIEGLPPGVTASKSQIGAGQVAVDVMLKADASAKIDIAHLTIRGTMTSNGQTLTRTATWQGPRGSTPIDTVLLAVALPTPFKIVGQFEMSWAARGTVTRRHYHIERNGFTGPLEVRLAERQARHLQGVTGPVIQVPAGATEFDYPFHLPPWMETGRTCRVCVMATGVVKEPDGKEHTVSFGSIQPNEQLIRVIEPGRLEIEAERSSFLAVPGKTLAVPLRVARGKSLQGTVKVELVVAGHLHGITAAPIVIPAGASTGTLSIQIGPNPSKPINLPLLVRATVMDHGEPIIAETQLDVQTRD
jgi:hypothetical protein